MTEGVKQAAGECAQTAQTAPYLDGELDGEAAGAFEEHARRTT